MNLVSITDFIHLDEIEIVSVVKLLLHRKSWLAVFADEYEQSFSLRLSDKTPGEGFLRGRTVAGRAFASPTVGSFDAD